MCSISFPKATDGSHFIRCYLDGQRVGMKHINTSDYLKYKEGVVSGYEMVEKYFKDELSESTDIKLPNGIKR